MPEPREPHEPDLPSAGLPGSCRECEDGRGDAVQTDRQGVVLLCATCLSRQLRGRLPWRRYLVLVLACLVAVPFLALFVGATSNAIAAAPSGSSPTTAMTLHEAVTDGWRILTTATDHWASLGVATAIAIALPVSLSTIASQGTSIGDRMKSAAIPNLDDHARLMLLDSALTISTGIAMLTAVLTFVLAIDALISGEPGWAQRTLFCLVLAAMLVVEVAKLGAFPKFADGTRLLVTADLARGVRDRRKRAKDLDWQEGLVAVAVVIVLHVLAYLAVTYPAAPTSIVKGFMLALLGAVSTALLASLASLYLRMGDRPTGAYTVATGVCIGVFWASIMLTVAHDMQMDLVNPWGTLLGTASFLPLYVLITLGLISTGPLKWLAYFTARIDDAITALDRAGRRRSRRST